MLVVGLTGGIASGKSTVSNLLKNMGAVIIDADVLARQAVEPGEEAWHKIKEYFGVQAINDDGFLNRKRIGEIVFNDVAKRKLLNSIIHPEVMAKTKELIDFYKNEGQAPLIVVDAPLLIEAGMQKLVDEVWVVSVNRELQVKRVMERDKLSREAALQRLGAQISTAEKLKYANRIIDNNLDLKHTISQVQEIWREVVNEGAWK